MTFSVALVYPDLLGTYGDGGNATVLAQRLRWRGFDAEVLPVMSTCPLPTSCNFYVIGGGEDRPQSRAVQLLRREEALARAVEGGAVVLAICAGLQLLGRQFEQPDGGVTEGLGLLDCATYRSAQRAVGEILVRPTLPEARDLPLLSGFENHAGVTEVGPGARSVGQVVVGAGNNPHGGAGRYEGAVSGKIWGTYLHGPVLARNPALADLLLSWVVGPLRPLDDTTEIALHDERVRKESERFLAKRHLGQLPILGPLRRSQKSQRGS